MSFLSYSGNPEQVSDSSVQLLLLSSLSGLLILSPVLLGTGFLHAFWNLDAPAPLEQEVLFRVCFPVLSSFRGLGFSVWVLALGCRAGFSLVTRALSLCSCKDSHTHRSQGAAQLLARKLLLCFLTVVVPANPGLAQPGELLNSPFPCKGPHPWQKFRQRGWLWLLHP